MKIHKEALCCCVALKTWKQHPAQKGSCVGLAGAQHKECQCSDAAGCALPNSAVQTGLWLCTGAGTKYLSHRAAHHLASCELEEVKEDGRGLGLRHGGKTGNVFYLAEVGDLF